MPERIEDYAIIGDTRTAALVSRNGSIDWLCLPHFNSDACFAALLGDPSHGRWMIAPAASEPTITRRYRPDTLVLETEYTTDTGTVRVIDFMTPWRDQPDVIRLVEGVSGSVPMRMELVVRFGYGSIVPWVQQGAGHLQAVAGPDALSLWTDVHVFGEGLTTQARFDVHAGDRVPFSLVWRPSHREGVKPPEPIQAVDDTCNWWLNWSSRCTYQGPWRDAVVRSLITLKALTFEPTGGIVAAPTTSLPECVGGIRNWDYRFCWLRDATYTLYALLVNGYRDEAAAWRNWLVRAVAGDPSTLQTMYGLSGERRLPELELPWLPGYEGSRPVRIGNDAVNQLQLDVYGEVMDALHLSRRAGIASDVRAWDLQVMMLEHLTRAWREPDEGIWEVRGPRRHFIHSKVMTWVAFDRAIRAVERFGLTGPADEWIVTREAIKADIMLKGFSEARGSFRQHYATDGVDASLLMLPLVGFIPGNDRRMVGTVRAIEQDLLWKGLVLRYRSHPDLDGLPRGEGAFLACSFWLVDNYVLQGRTEEARTLFERLLGVRNDLGLLAEEYDPIATRQLGNFPQAFSHVMLINSARNLSGAGHPADDRTG